MWPEPVQRVADHLRAAHAEAKLEEFPAGTKTAEDAARAVGVEPAQIVKSLVCECDGRIVVVLVPGDRRADLAKVARAAGAARAKIVPPDRVEAATGFAPGAVAPFPLPVGTIVLVDANLLAHDEIWAGAGSSQHVMGLRPAELIRLSRGRSVDAISGGTYDSA